VNDDLMLALTELRDARPAYEKAERYYEGEAPEKFSSPKVQKLLNGTRGDFAPNLAARPVDAVLDRLEIAAIVCEPDEHTAALRDRVWDPNELDIEMPQVLENALQYGDCYLFVWDGDDTDDGQPTVDVFYNSPLTMRIIYDPENPRRKKLAIKSWCEGLGAKERVRVNLYYPDHFEKWITKEGAKGDKEADFEPYVDDDTDERGWIGNPHGEIPVFHFRTRRPYGRPEHKRAYGPQDAVTKLVVNQMATSDFAAFPQRAGLLDPTASSDDDIDWGNDDETDPGDRESQLVAHPGSLWTLRGYKELMEFSAADPDAFIKPIGLHTRFMAATTTTPFRWFDPSGDVPSGESIRADDAPLVKKISARQRSFGSTSCDAFEFALRILDITAKVMVQWAPAQTTGDLEFWQAVLAKQDAGVPVRQSLLEAGYTDKQVDAWGYTEEQPNGPDGWRGDDEDQDVRRGDQQPPDDGQDEPDVGPPGDEQ